MNSIRYGCTSLAGVNKIGELVQDSDGYYEVVVGALNMHNSAGDYYVFEQARELFESSSSALMRRVTRGALRGEYGHPKPEYGQNMDSFAHRVMRIDESNVCCHHAELTLDFNRVKGADGRPVIAIISKMAPNGPLGHVLERQLQNKRENVCFSIRSFTEDYMDRGTKKRILKTVVTFDYVNEPGIAVAEKWKSPALESFKEEDMVFSRGNIERAVRQPQVGLSMESSVTMNAQELFRTMGWQADLETIQAFTKAPSWKGWA